MRRFSVLGSKEAPPESPKDDRPLSSFGTALWTEEDRAVLRAGLEAGDSYEEIAAALNRTAKAIAVQAAKMRARGEMVAFEAPPLKRERRQHRRHWTRAENATLRRMIADGDSIEEIARVLGRTIGATREHARRLAPVSARVPSPVRRKKPKPLAMIGAIAAAALLGGGGVLWAVLQ